MEGSVRFCATGRRKTSVARVWLSPGEGSFIVNRRPMDTYFQGHQALITYAKEPLKVTETSSRYNITANVYGGGISGQAGAVRLGIARALVLADGLLRDVLKRGGYLTRDPRMKERKKYGQKGARARFQFSKR